jgi:hypothetical protein
VADGGGWGEEFRHARARIEASPAALLVQSKSQQKSFPFLLEEKIRRAQKKSRENFFAGWRALASGGGAASFVGVRLVKSSDFIQETQHCRKNMNLGPLRPSDLSAKALARKGPPPTPQLS